MSQTVSTTVYILFLMVSTKFQTRLNNSFKQVSFTLNFLLNELKHVSNVFKQIKQLQHMPDIVFHLTNTLSKTITHVLQTSSKHIQTRSSKVPNMSQHVLTCFKPFQTRPNHFKHKSSKSTHISNSFKQVTTNHKTNLRMHTSTHN